MVFKRWMIFLLIVSLIVGVYSFKKGYYITTFKTVPIMNKVIVIDAGHGGLTLGNQENMVKMKMS